jgi:hypothetical protein
MSDQATAFWARLKQWYGYSFVEKHGERPSRDWEQLINTTDRDTILNALATIKNLHPKFPPTYPEVAEAIRKASKPVDKVDVRVVLSEYVLREYHAGRLGITYRQLGYTWKWIAHLEAALDSQGVMRDNQICNYLGVEIQPDPHNPQTRAMRIMFDEIEKHEIQGLLEKNWSRSRPKAVV